MRKLALSAVLCACHATSQTPPPAPIAPHPIETAAVVAPPEVAPVVTPPPAPAPPPAPPFGLLFARHCDGYLRPFTASPSASRLLACDRIFDDEGRFHATPRPVAALFDDGAMLVFERNALARLSPDRRVEARSATSTVDAQSDLVALGPNARTALWFRSRTLDLVELDVASMRALRRVRLEAHTTAIAYAHDGTPFVYSADEERRALARWEGASLVDIPLPRGTREVALAELGTAALALTDRSHFTTISLPDGNTRAAHTLAVGDEPTLPTPTAPLVSPSPDGRSVVVCDARGLSLQRLDTSAEPVLLHDRCGGPPRFSSDGRSIVTGEFNIALLREGAPPRTRARHEPITFELSSAPDGFVPWNRVDDRGQDVLVPQGSSADEQSHMVPEGYVRAWHHSTAGANLWVTHHDDDPLRLDQPLEAWALAALDVFGDGSGDVNGLVAWRGSDGARAVEARWRQGGCDPADVILRVQERQGGVMIVRLEVWSSRERRERWWRAMVSPVLGEAPADAASVTVPREESR